MAHLYVDESGPSQVEIGEKAASAMLSLCEQADHLETGGILIGSYSVDGAVAHVREALGPPKGSQSTQTGFVRSCSGLSEVLQRKWTRHQHYLGEWHFHPEGRSIPSTQDRRQMAEIGSHTAYRCPSPILIVVGGSVEDWKLGVWVLSDGELLRLREPDQDPRT